MMVVLFWISAAFVTIDLALCYNNYGQQTSKGLVYYPPYSDPTDETNPCEQLYDWNLAPQETFQPPKYRGGTCHGSVNGFPFTAPQSLSDDDKGDEPFEDFVVTMPTNDADGNGSVDFDDYEDEVDYSNQLLSFTCRDRHGQVRGSSLYFWIYQYRFRRIVKSHFYQTMMPWDTEGKMLFQPMEPRQANITCHYYDTKKGYFVRVRTWRLTFSRSKVPPSSVISKTAESISCNSGLAALSSSPNKEIDVVVTSNRLELAAFCPVATCLTKPPSTSSRSGYLSIKYEPMIPYFCKSKPDDTASYSMCIIDPLQVDHFEYTCTPSPGRGITINNQQQKKPSGSVRINIHSGARFSHEDDFKPVYFKEDDLNRALACSVDPETSPDASPEWQHFDSATNQYKEIDFGDDFQAINDTVTGRHRLIIKRVKLEHEGGYRCVVAQSSKTFQGESIYGYYFVRVYPQPRCSLFDTVSNRPIVSNNTDDNIPIDLVKNHQLAIKCSGAIENITSDNCQSGGDLCSPTVLLYKNGMICSMSNNADQNSCGGSQKVAVKSVVPLEIDLTLRKVEEPTTTTLTALAGSGSGDRPQRETLIMSDDGAQEERQLDYEDAVKQHSFIERDAGSYVLQLVYPPPANVRIEIPLKIVAEAPPKPTTTTTTMEPITTTATALELVLEAVKAGHDADAGAINATTPENEQGDNRTVCVSFCINWDCAPWWNWLIIVLGVFVLAVLIAALITCCYYHKRSLGGNDHNNSIYDNVADDGITRKQPQKIVINMDDADANHIGEYATIHHHEQQQPLNSSGSSTAVDNRPLLSPKHRQDDDVGPPVVSSSRQPLLLTTRRPSPPVNRRYNQQDHQKAANCSRLIHKDDIVNI